MSSEKERFTAWLSIAERQAIRTRAQQFGTSENYVVRMAIRQALEIGTPTHAAQGTADKPQRV